MLQTKAIFRCKEPEIEAKDCVVDKIIRLSGAEFDRFSRGLMRDWDFIRGNQSDTTYDAEGRTRCLLVVGAGRRDGILVDSQGYDYARYTALMPHAEAAISAAQYPSLAALTQKLTAAADYVVSLAAGPLPEGANVSDPSKYAVSYQYLSEHFDVSFGDYDALTDVFIGMLHDRPEIDMVKPGVDEFLIDAVAREIVKAEDLADPSVTPTDMYAYGYGWDGMIPLGKDRALELYDEGHTVFRLSENDAEGAAMSREDIETFDGMFGVEDPAWAAPEQEPPLQAFILNREKYDRGEAAGEWLTLPADAGDLCGLFERIGIGKPSEGAFTVTAVRVRDDYVRDHVSKYDSLDELNMLGSYLETTADFNFVKFEAILSSGIMDVGRGTAALINLLHCDNLDAFELIDAKDPEALARYYDRENNEKPDDVSFEQYGKHCAKKEGGEFTEHGYIKCRHKDLSPEYSDVVPEAYKITGMALHFLRLKKPERGGQDERPSVLEKIRAAQNAPKSPRRERTPGKKKGEPDL